MAVNKKYEYYKKNVGSTPADEGKHKAFEDKKARAKALEGKKKIIERDGGSTPAEKGEQGYKKGGRIIRK